MGEQKPASWYDEQAKASARREYLVAYNPPWPRLARWPGRFREVCKELDKGLPVLDIGCGPGIFAAYLWHSGFREAYCGVDFSPVVLKLARAGNDAVAESGHPDAKFFRYDVQKTSVWAIKVDVISVFSTPPQITILETLEHLENDLDVVESIPSGHKTVITVPRFDEPDHVRYFKRVEDVSDRYAHFFEDALVRVIRRNWILISGVKR